MKLMNRERVDGTPVTIGNRVYYRDGRKQASKRYSAEYRDATGKQVCEGLGTSSRLEARRMAVEIFTRLMEGRPRIIDSTLRVEELVEAYFQTAKARGLARKTEWKYATDLDKLKEFCREKRISLAHRFGRDAFFAYRQWLVEKNYADKTIYGALTLAKQVFKWGFQEGRLREYRLGAAKIAKAKARPQPCFTTDQVELVVANSLGAEKVAFATLAYAGLRIGELEQLQWTDVELDRGEARYVLDRWRMDYNHHRPHSRLDWMTPAAFAASCVPSASATPNPSEHTKENMNTTLTQVGT